MAPFFLYAKIFSPFLCFPSSKSQNINLEELVGDIIVFVNLYSLKQSFTRIAQRKRRNPGYSKICLLFKGIVKQFVHFLHLRNDKNEYCGPVYSKQVIVHDVSNIAVVLSTLHILIVGTVYFYGVENLFGSDHTWAVS